MSLLPRMLRPAPAIDDAYPNRPRPTRATVVPSAWSITRLAAFAATAFYVAQVIPFCPHADAWVLHLGCVLSLAASWWIALRRPAVLSLRGLLFGLASICVLCAGVERAAAVEAALEREAWWLEREQRMAAGTVPPDARDWHNLSVLGEDRIGLLKARAAALRHPAR